jgi:tol-pal system protein YbgF
MMKSRRNRSKVARAAAALFAAAALGACATKNDIRSLHDELRTLAIRQDSLIAELRLEARSTQDTLRTQSDQLFDFRGDIARQLQSLVQSMTRLEAVVGETQRGMVGIRDQLANTRRLPADAGPAPTPDSAGGSRPGAETVPGAGGNAEQLYGVAREQHQRGSFSTAQRAYAQFLQEYPSHALAADAQFYLGDILVQQSRPEDGLAAFLQVQTLYPTAPRVPDALYRAAIIQRELGRNDDAKATLQRIINTYPDASIAMLARDLLAEIG